MIKNKSFIPVTRKVFTTKKLIFSQSRDPVTVAIMLSVLYEVGTKFSQYTHGFKHT